MKNYSAIFNVCFLLVVHFTSEDHGKYLFVMSYSVVKNMDEFIIFPENNWIL